MTLDLTKWATGSDGDLLPQPINSGALTFTPADQQITITLSSGALLKTHSSPDLLDVYLESTSGTIFRRTMPSDIPGRVTDSPLRVVERLATYAWFPIPSRPTELNSSALYVSGEASGSRFRAYNWTRDGNNGLWTNPVAGTVLDLWYQKDSSGLQNIEVFTPYAWAELDLAELVFAITRFYTGGGTTARDLLDFGKLNAYSLEMDSNPITRVRFDYWRESGRPMGSTIRNLITQAGAIAGFGAVDSGVLNMNFWISHPDLVEENTRTYDYTTELGVQEAQAFDDRRTVANMSRISNTARVRWGSALSFSYPVSLAGDNVPSANFQSPARPKGDENLIAAQDAASIALYGESQLRGETDCPHLFDEDYASAAMQLGRFLHPPRERPFGFGPRHLNFLLGEVIKVTDTNHGLDGPEPLWCVEKTYDWDRMAASGVLVEKLPDVYVMEPDDEAVADKLSLWLDANTGITLGTGTDVDTWADQSGNGNDAGILGRGIAVKPQLVTAAQNGLDAVDFDVVFGGGMDLNGWTTTEGEHTILAVVEVGSSAVLTGGDRLLHSNTIGAGEELIVGVIDVSGDVLPLYSDDGTNKTIDTDPISSGWHILVWRFAKGGGGALHINEAAALVDDGLTGKHGVGTYDSDGVNVGDDTSLGNAQDGSGNNWQGKIGELLFYDGVLLPHQIRGIRNYLNAKWAIY